MEYKDLTQNQKDDFQNWKREREKYYGIKYGTFSWIRGTIDIYDVDDLDYIKICLDKMGERFLEEQKEKKKK